MEKLYMGMNWGIISSGVEREYFGKLNEIFLIRGNSNSPFENILRRNNKKFEFKSNIVGVMYSSGIPG
jgi:hypothetical protein